MTPTWRRPELLSRCLQNVRQQDYHYLEHIVVSDGPDAHFKQHACWGHTLVGSHRKPFHRVIYDALPEHIEPPNSRPGIEAARRGCDLAKGDLLFFLPDDDLLMPGAISRMVEAMEGVDFVYTAVAMVFGDKPMTVEGADYIIGTDPPTYGGITNYLFPRELRQVADYEPHPSGPDWLQVSKWMEAGMTWRFIPDVLQIHHVDN